MVNKPTYAEHIKNYAFKLLFVYIIKYLQHKQFLILKQMKPLNQ